MRNFLYTLVILLFPISAYADIGIKQPNPDIAPIDVVRIQLEALQNNDTPTQDFGIKQTWAFAHPDNRAVTGPLDRFKNMMRTPAYQMLLNHNQHTITEQNRSTRWVQFKVMMEDSNGQVLAFAWVVKKAETAPYENCWMTTAVSAPVRAGQGS